MNTNEQSWTQPHPLMKNQEWQTNLRSNTSSNRIREPCSWVWVKENEGRKNLPDDSNATTQVISYLRSLFFFLFLWILLLCVLLFFNFSTSSNFVSVFNLCCCVLLVLYFHDDWRFKLVKLRVRKWGCRKILGEDWWSFYGHVMEGSLSCQFRGDYF